MQIQQTGGEKLRKNFRITIEAADINRAMESELKTIGQRVKIPGFRPGFVPLKVLQQRYGKSVQGDVLKNVISDATEKAIRDNKLRIAMQPDVKVEDYKEAGDLVFTMAVDTMPEVPELKLTDIALEREVFEVGDDAVSHALDMLAKGNPKVVPQPAGAKAEMGNVVTMDFKGSIDGVPFEGGEAQNFRIELGSNRLIPGFEDQLVGAKTGEQRELNVTFPENYFNKEMAGKKASFDVTVKEVAKLETADLDDAFAKERGLADLAALKEAVRGQLGKEYGDIVRTRLKKRLFDELENLCDYPLPAAMVEMEFNGIWSRLQQAKAQDEDVYEGKSEAEVKKEYQAIAERRVRLGLLLADIGQKEKIQVSREELTKAVMEQAQQFPGQEKAVFDYYRKNPQKLDELRGPILEEKAVDWILAKVKMKDKKVTTKELAETGYDEAGPVDKSAGSEKKATPKKKAPGGKKKTGSDEE